MSDKNFLSVEDLVVEYTSEDKVIHAVNHLSFQLAKGASLGLVGETGAGKTTVAKAIMRILPDMSARICQGKIYLDDRELVGLEEKKMQKIRGSVASMIFQDPMTTLNPTIKVGEQIAEAVLAHNKVSAAEAQKRAVDMLRMVGISEERFNEYPFQFSGGMKQRVVIAIALACNPQLLIADEPTTALDVTIQAQVLDMIRNLKKEFNTTLILITHDLGIVGQMCDTVCVMYAGNIIESGEKFEIFDHPKHPYTQGLFAALPEMAGGDRRLHPIDGLPPDPSNLPKGCSFSPRCPRVCEKCLEGDIPMIEIAPQHFCRCCNIGKEGDLR